MKKILLIIGLVILSVSVFAQEEVFSTGQTPTQFRAAGNDKFDRLTDSLIAALDTIRIQQDSLDIHADSIYSYDTRITAAAASGGGGDFTKDGTTANTEIGVMTGDGTLGSSSDLVFDGSALSVNGNIDADTLVESTADAGVNIDQSLIKDKAFYPNFADPDTYIGQTTNQNELWFYIGGSAAFVFSNSFVQSGRTFIPTGGDTYDLGLSVQMWKDLYIQRTYFDDVNTYVYNNAGVLTFVDGTTGSKTLAELSAGGGTGDVTKVGTPVNNQVGVWTGDGTLEGTSGLTYNGGSLQISGTLGFGTGSWMESLTANTISFYTGSTSMIIDPTAITMNRSLNINNSTTIDSISQYAITDDDSYVPTAGAVVDYAVAISDGVTSASELYLLLDTIPAYTFGAGSGLAGDTVLFAKDAHGFGMFNTKNDTTVCLVDLLRISAGDSLTFNIYWGNGMTLTASDSLFNAPEPVGVNQGSLTVDDAKIPPDQDVWVELKADQVLTATPNEIVIQLSKQIIRD